MKLSSGSERSASRSTVMMEMVPQRGAVGGQHFYRASEQVFIHRPDFAVKCRGGKNPGPGDL
jgi:hypothetical protein